MSVSFLVITNILLQTHSSDVFLVYWFKSLSLKTKRISFPEKVATRRFGTVILFFPVSYFCRFRLRCNRCVYTSFFFLVFATSFWPILLSLWLIVCNTEHYLSLSFPCTVSLRVWIPERGSMAIEIPFLFASSHNLFNNSSP